MKASLKFREDQRPLARAKIPISILGLPFLAGAAAGDPLDLRLDLTTAFDSGPALRVSYRPNEPFSPFTLAVKTGIGAFGSPIAAPLSMITEFNIFSSHTSSSSPSFSLLFKPRLGDFCFRKSASSSPPSRKIVPASDGEEMFPSSPSLAPGGNGIHPGGKANGVVVDFPAARGGIGGLLSGIEVAARSVLPIRGRAMVGFRWGFRLPRTDLQSSFSADTFSVANLPMLLMNKISIEHVPVAARSKLLRDSGPNVAAGEEGAEACRSVRQDIAALQAESAVLRKAVEDLREKINGSGFSSGMMFPAIGNNDGCGAEAGKGGLRAAAPEPSKRERRSEAKSVAEDVNEELKKALMNASAAGK